MESGEIEERHGQVPAEGDVAVGGIGDGVEDMTESQLLELRRTIYLTIMSSITFEEVAHKLLKSTEDAHIPVVAQMIVECCANERTYNKLYGLRRSGWRSSGPSTRMRSTSYSRDST